MSLAVRSFSFWWRYIRPWHAHRERSVVCKIVYRIEVTLQGGRLFEDGPIFQVLLLHAKSISGPRQTSKFYYTGHSSLSE